MSENMDVVPVSIEGTMPTADGKYVLVNTKSGDTGMVVAVELDQAFTLISGVASSAEKCREIQGLAKSDTYAMTVRDWSLSMSESGEAIFAFEVLGGTKLSFGMDTSQIAIMRQGLQSMEAALAKPANATSQ